MDNPTLRKHYGSPLNDIIAARDPRVDLVHMPFPPSSQQDQLCKDPNLLKHFVGVDEHTRSSQKVHGLLEVRKIKLCRWKKSQ